MRLHPMFSLALACLVSCFAVIANPVVSMITHLFSIVPRFAPAAPFAFRSEPRSIFDTRRMGLA